MTAEFVVGARAAPVLGEERPQVLRGRPEIPARVHRPEFRISGNAPVEGVHQAAEGLLAADRLVEAGRFCRDVHDWRPGYVSPALGGVRCLLLLSVIVTRRPQFALALQSRLSYMHHALRLWVFCACRTLTSAMSISQILILAERLSSYIESVSPGLGTAQP